MPVLRKIPKRRFSPHSKGKTAGQGPPSESPRLLLRGRRGGGSSLGDVGEVLLDHGGVLRRQRLRHRLPKRLALPRGEVVLAAPAVGVATVRLLVLGGPVGPAVALALLLGVFLALAGLLAG